jgi:thiamine biosynthesis protein ThiC
MRIIVGVVIGILIGTTVTAMADIQTVYNIRDFLGLTRNLQLGYTAGALDMASTIADDILNGHAATSLKSADCLRDLRTGRTLGEVTDWMIARAATNIVAHPVYQTASVMIADACVR